MISWLFLPLVSERSTRWAVSGIKSKIATRLHEITQRELLERSQLYRLIAKIKRQSTAPGILTREHNRLSCSREYLSFGAESFLLTFTSSESMTAGAGVTLHVQGNSLPQNSGNEEFSANVTVPFLQPLCVVAFLGTNPASVVVLVRSANTARLGLTSLSFLSQNFFSKPIAKEIGIRCCKKSVEC